MEDKKTLKKAINIFKASKTDPNGVLISEEIIANRLLKTFKKLKYKKDSLFLELIQLTDNKFNDKEETSTRVDYVEKREIDTPTLYSFDGPFRLIHPDVGNLEFLGKNAAIPKYASLVVDHFSSKVYVYPMRVTEN